MSDVHKPSFPAGAGGVWFGPTLAVLVAALLIWKPFGGGVEEEELLAAGPQLEGELELSQGGRVSVRLDPLHQDPHRQAFDKDALARRLELPAGEPWSLRFESAGEAPPSAPLQVLVLDQEGACLSPILADAARRAGAVEDPLRSLFQPHELQGDSSGWQLVLWGRAPGPGGRLECSWGSAALLEVSAEEDLDAPVVHSDSAPLNKE